MQLKPLLEEMTRIAGERRDACLAEAEQQANSIIEEARTEREQKREAALEDARRDAEIAERNAREQGRADAERTALMLQETVAEDAIRRVRDKIRHTMSTSAASQIVEALLAELAGELGAGRRVLVSPDHAGVCRRWLAEHDLDDTEVVEDAGIVDGVAVEDADRSFRITNTLSARLDKRQNDARRLCLDMLFDGDES